MCLVNQGVFCVVGRCNVLVVAPNTSLPESSPSGSRLTTTLLTPSSHLRHGISTLSECQSLGLATPCCFALCPGFTGGGGGGGGDGASGGAGAAAGAIVDPVLPTSPSRREFRAFVVGNNAYQRMSGLDKCVNDARAVGALLERKGYSVTLLEDADVGTFRHTFSRFTASLCAGCSVVLHFSGHGCQAAGSNYLVFVDQTEADAAEGAVMMEPFCDRRVQVGCSVQLATCCPAPSLPRTAPTADPRCSLDEVISLARDQLIATAHALYGQEASAGSITVFMDACRKDEGLSTTAVKGSDSEK